MEVLNNGTQSCANPKIVAGRLTSMRHIYLRQELHTISKQIQDQYKERLPALQLVSLAAYEQVFQRQPLSLPEERRRDAVKYALKYYQLHIEKLRMAEAQNGLCPAHDRLSCFDKKCPLHESDPVASNHNLSNENQTGKRQSKTNSEQNSSRSSLASDNTLNSTATDTSSISTLVSSDEHSVSSPSTFSDTPSDRRLDSSATDPFSESTSDRSMTTETPSHTKVPKIVISRTSDKSPTSNDTKDSSSTIDEEDDDQTSTST